LFLPGLETYRINFRPFVIWTMNNQIINHNPINDYIFKNFPNELKNSISADIINSKTNPKLFI